MKALIVLTISSILAGSLTTTVSPAFASAKEQALPVTETSSASVQQAAKNAAGSTTPTPAATSKNTGPTESAPNTPPASTAKVLRGSISHTVSPFKEDGSSETIKEGTSLNLTFSANLNSELSQVGDKVIARVSTDLKDGTKVVLPGQWYVVGQISRIEGRKRMGRDGYCEIKFEKLVSPDCKFEAPIDATISTKDSTIKSIVTQTAKGTANVSVGAFAGSLLSVQMTGLPVAISTHGLSVAVGATAGAIAGLAAFLHKKGDILCTLPGDEVSVRLPLPIKVPAFNQEVLQMKKEIPKLDNVNIEVLEKKFLPDPYGDKRSRLLGVKIKIDNHSKKTYGFENIAVISDRGEQYPPYVTSMVDKQRFQKVAPEASREADITFGVAGPKCKYWLVLWDQARSNILSQVPIN